jgi:hypothetical protein
MFCFVKAQDETSQYADFFGCGQGQFPIRYLESQFIIGGSQLLNGKKSR